MPKTERRLVGGVPGRPRSTTERDRCWCGEPTSERRSLCGEECDLHSGCVQAYVAGINKVVSILTPGRIAADCNADILAAIAEAEGDGG